MQNQIVTIEPLERPPSLNASFVKPRVQTRGQQLKQMIGNTPLLRIHFRYRGRERAIYAKAEHMNLTGSIKDRMAFHILRKAYQKGDLQAGRLILEATSGNTGISFS